MEKKLPYGYESALLERLKQDYELEKNIKLDFRSHKHLKNEYGNHACFDYRFAEKIVEYMFKWIDDFFGRKCFDYNLKMSIESLKTTTLKIFILSHLRDAMNLKKGE